MQGGYETLDRHGGFNRVRLFSPLAHRDYRLLIGGQSISLFGDGLFLVALAWQVYELSDAPAALATVGIAMTVPTVVCLLAGGAVSDRFDRCTVMLVADATRALLLGLLAALSVLGELRMWSVLAIAAGVGAATAFFNPASDAIVPQLLPEDKLAQANSLDQLVRPLMLRMAGPAVGGLVVAGLGAGCAFGVDAGTSVFSALMLLSIARRPAGAPSGAMDSGALIDSETRADSLARVDPGAPAGDVRSGLRYVFANPWLWATFVSAAVAYLLFMGPTEVLVPFLVKHRFAHGARDLGLIFAAGGLGSLACAVVVGQRDVAVRSLTPMYLVWTFATLAVAGYGIFTGLWGLMLASVVFNTLETAGTIEWATAKQRHVPTRMLGRVSSLDWLISIGLLPVSYALTAPVSAAIGVRTTLIGAGVLGAVVTFLPVLSRRARSIARLDPV